MATNDTSNEDSSKSEKMANSPSIQVSLPTNTKILRSPSRESVATELSLYSVSSYNSENIKTAVNSRFGINGLKTVPENRLYLSSPQHNQQQLPCLSPNRQPSPIPGHSNSHFLKVPGNVATLSVCSNSYLSDMWLEEETDLNVIKNCAALSTPLGLQKSFSTGDIVAYMDFPDDSHSRDLTWPKGENLRSVVSDAALGSVKSHIQYEANRFGMTSRFFSTWVAVGDEIAMSLPHTISSQLPSPQGRPSSVHVENACDPTEMTSRTGASFTAADLIRSVNKRVRQHYIRRRLLTTYKALERLSQSQFNLDQIAAVAVTTSEIDDSIVEQSKDQTLSANPSASKNSLTINDVEREQGQPLSKYERNMMIFNWLHKLEEVQADIIQ